MDTSRMSMEYYRKEIEEILSSLQTTDRGLDPDEARQRLGRYGHNLLETETGINPLEIFINQFKNFIIYILLFAVVFSLIIGEYIDSAIILAILAVNAAIGFIQELSAHKSLAALKKLSAIRATVIRNGVKENIDAGFLVPGDLIYLEAGDKVPADARLIQAAHLKVEESALTGESIPAEKNPLPILDEVQIGDRHNMLFSSTSVLTGSATAVVTATGMQTEIGRITSLVKEAEENQTPLQKRLHHFGRKLGAAIIGICIFIFFISLAREFLTGTLSLSSLVSFAFIAISLAVAAVPTALPAVVTIALSIGVKRLLHKKALVRKLSSVETLGSCDVICTDKTGTLTENQMTVRHAWTPEAEVEISGGGYSSEGTISAEIPPLLFRIGQVCNNASLRRDENGQPAITGDPTEVALLVSAGKAGLPESTPIRRDEIPFDSERKLMSVLVREDSGEEFIYCKGAPGQLLAVCSKVLIGGHEAELTREMRELILESNEDFAARALRVLGFAYGKPDSPAALAEKDLVFVGLQAMIDPPRPEVVDSIAKTRSAGIRVIMITGDYQATAKSIGRELGILGKVCTGEQLEQMDDHALLEALREETNIFARVVPEHKQRIVRTLQQMGHTVAMTGDGVNDAPALKKADIGVAVGSGTEVAKEAADFVLLDDSFTHIVNAIEEGRGIYDNIQKSIMLLLSGNLGEVLIIFIASILGMNLPLTAILLLWINMITDGAPALAYSVDPYGTRIMQRRPKPRDENILPGPKLTLIVVLGSIGTILALSLFSLTGGNSPEPAELMRAQTMVFNFIVIYELILVFVIRSSYQVPVFSNQWIWWSVTLSLALQGILMYTPLHAVFRISPLSLKELGILGAGGVLFLMATVFYRYLGRLNRKTAVQGAP